MNIILIVSDTFRRDNLNCYVDTKVRTPNLDRFAQKCVIFDNCYACSFPSIPARADILTGKWTFTYHGWEPLPQDEIVLAEVLTKAGFHTKAVVDPPFFVSNAYHYDRGFQDFELIRGQGGERSDINLQRRYETDYCAPATMLAASRWLERHYKEKIFLYVDTLDPHEPWDQPSWYTELYYPSYDGKVYYPCYWTWKDATEVLSQGGVKPLETPLSEEDVKIGYASYCGEVTMVDRWVGFLLDTIESMNLMDKTIMLFTTDHGFYFGEHGQFGKAMIKHLPPPRRIFRSPLYEEVAHIPLLMYVPGIKAGRSDALVCLPDLMPTILELAGAEIPSTAQGKSLAPSLMGDTKEIWDFVVTSWPLYNPGDATQAVDSFEKGVQEFIPSTITTKEWTLLYASEGQPAELYHLPTDPHQEKNVINDKIDVARELHSNFVSRLVEYGTPQRTLKPRQHL